MALSNKFGAIVLSTGNKSELGVGYCTLYGDMVGGLAVISDVPKTMVYRLSRYVNSRRPVIPQATLEKPPSAELRPDQKDIDSLPPYDVLDAILEDYVEDLHTAEQIAADHNFDLALVQRVIRMVDGAEYKRQQAAPGLKISLQGLRLRPPLSHRRQDELTMVLTSRNRSFRKELMRRLLLCCSLVLMLVSLAVAQQKSSAQGQRTRFLRSPPSAPGFRRKKR